MSVKENTVFSIYDKCTNAGVIQKSKVESLVDDYIKELKIKTPNREQIAKNLIWWKPTENCSGKNDGNKLRCADF